MKLAIKMNVFTLMYKIWPSHHLVEQLPSLSKVEPSHDYLKLYLVEMCEPY
jgi:hypothetical protein